MSIQSITIKKEHDGIWKVTEKYHPGDNNPPLKKSFNFAVLKEAVDHVNERFSK